MADGQSERHRFVPRGRRRRANVDGGRQHQHQVKVSPEEEALLQRLAAEYHVTVPRLLVEAALTMQRGESVAERREAVTVMFGLHRLLAGIANNVNQMARATNATGDVQDGMNEALYAVRRTAQRIDEAVDRLTT